MLLDSVKMCCATASGSAGSQSTEGRDQAVVLQLLLGTMFEASAPQPVLYNDDDNCCSGFPSPMDVPTRLQATARESGRECLRLLLALASPLAASSHSVGSDGGDTTAVDASVSSSSNPACSVSDSVPLVGAAGGPPTTSASSSYAEWEVLQDQLLATASTTEVPSDTVAEGSQAASSFGCWDEALWCFNPACTNLSGPSELALKTLVCGGGCGVRYCSPECQAQGWRDGHRLSCGRLRDRRAARTMEVSGWVGGGVMAFQEVSAVSVNSAQSSTRSHIIAHACPQSEQLPSAGAPQCACQRIKPCSPETSGIISETTCQRIEPCTPDTNGACSETTSPSLTHP